MAMHSGIPAGPSIPRLIDALRLFWRTLQLLRPVWWRLFRISSIGVVVTLLGLLMPLFSKVLLDDVYPAGDFDLLIAIIIAMAIVQLASTAMGALQGFHSFLVTNEVGRQADVLYFNHVQHLPVSFFDNHRVGEILARAADLRATINAATGFLSAILLRGINYLMVPPILLMLNPTLCLLALAPLPLTAAVSLVSGRIIRRLTKQGAEIGAEASAYRIETLSRIRTVKSLAIESSVLRSYSDQVLSAQEAQVRSRLVGVWAGMISSVIRIAGQMALAWVGWRFVLQGTLTLGSYMAFMAYIGYVTRPISQLMGTIGSFQRLAVSLARAWEYLDTLPEQDPMSAYAPLDANPRLRLGGQVELRGVSFCYPTGRRVLEDIDLTLHSGERVAIVGSNGAGKSTLLRLLGLIDVPGSGDVLFDGRDVRRSCLRDMRRQITLVWQEPALMRGTVRENLLLGVPRITDAELDDAVRRSGLGELIDGLPGGLETTIADMGSTLSGGQRQRIAIARARLSRRPILLLDEATSNIDVLDERMLLDSLFEDDSCRLVVFVTHRLAGAASADRIICLERGRVAGIGGHKELLTGCHAYRQLVSFGGVPAKGVIPLDPVVMPAERERHDRTLNA
jgi:ATP-binding cassette, subfamily B, bacterial HlyB/CyaB